MQILSEKPLSIGKLTSSSFIRFWFSLESLNFIIGNKYCQLFPWRACFLCLFLNNVCQIPKSGLPSFVCQLFFPVKGYSMKHRLVQLISQAITQMLFRKTTTARCIVELLHASFPFHQTEHEKDMCGRVFTASPGVFSNKVAVRQWSTASIPKKPPPFSPILLLYHHSEWKDSTLELL